MKKDYEIYLAIKNNSGFGWDDLQSMPTAPDSVWAAYVQAHPEAEKFRKRSQLHYDILHELCANISATGEFALTPNLSSQSETQFQAVKALAAQDQTSQYPTTLSAINENLVNEGWGSREVSEVNGSSASGNALEERSEVGTRRRVWITGEEEEGKGVGRALVEGDRESGQSVSRETKREKRNAMEILSGDEAEEEGSLRVGKRRRPDRKTSGRAIAQALDRLGATAQTIQRSKVELAIERLQQDYASVLTIDELVQGFTVMENEVKASIFIALRSGEARDKWLREAINQV